MLREHYPVDKLFEEVLGYVPDLSPELMKIDTYLEDEKLYRLIKKDLSQRRPKTAHKREGTRHPWMWCCECWW